MTFAPVDQRDLGPFDPQGLWRRITPFAGVVITTLAVATFSAGSAHPMLFAVTISCALVCIAAALFLPWEHLPRWSQAVVPLAFFPVVAMLREATGGPTSPFTVLVLLPVLLFALYGNRREVLASVVLLTAVLALPTALAGTARYPTSELHRAALYAVMSAFIGLTVNMLVTQLKHSAHDLVEAKITALDARDHFAAVLEAATQFSIIATDARGVITVFNEGAGRLTGYSSDEMVGRNPLHLHDADEVRRRAADLGIEPGFEVFVHDARAGRADVQDWTYIRKYGQRITVSLTSTAIRDADGAIAGFIGIAQDVTTDRRNQAEINEQAHRSSLINDLTHAIRQDLEPDSVLRRTVTSLGQRLDVDRVVVRIVEDDSVGVIAESWARPGLDPLPSGAAPAAGIVRLSRRSAGDDAVLAIFDVQDDARLRPAEAAEIVGYAIQGYLGAPMWVGSRLMGWVSLHSTTPRVWTRNEIAILQALARTVGAALLQAQSYQQEHEIVRRLRELDQTKSDFVSSVSHELRTPLTSITGYLEMLVDGEAGALTVEQLRLVEVVDRNSHRLLDLIEQLLSLSRIEAGNLPTGLDTVDLAAVVREVHRSVLPLLSERRLRFDVVVDGEVGRVLGDGSQLERVVSNLVTNAIKFTPDDGQVSLRAERAADNVRLVIADTGIGIPEAEQDQLFTRFFRASTARENAVQGTGLGLAIVKSIVDAHRGSIAVESASGVGTTITVELPLAVPARQPVGV
ncbi:MAG: PAS domain-containing sensor histidine kinase [Sporichthyaceae bacterium]